MLIENKHFRHFENNTDTLVISYAPINLPAGKLPHYKRLAALGVDRLSINPGTNNFYQDCIDEVSSIVNAVSATYNTVIHYGYSAGAYAALRFGLDNPSATAIFAVGPHINLKRPFTRSSVFSNCFSPDERDWNLLSRINSANLEHVYMFYSCCDVMDGAQIEDSLCIRKRNATNIYYNIPHEMDQINQPFEIIRYFIENKTHKPISPELFSSEEGKLDCIKAYNLYCQVRSGSDSFIRDQLILPVSSECGLLSFWQARSLEQIGFYEDACMKYNEALLKLHHLPYNLGDLYFCMGNNFLRLGFLELAFGAYHEGMRWDWRHVDVHRTYAREAGRRHRFDEIRNVMRKYEKTHGQNPSLDAIAVELEHSLSLAKGDTETS